MWIIYGAGIIPAFFLGMIFRGYAAACALGVEIIGGRLCQSSKHLPEHLETPFSGVRQQTGIDMRWSLRLRYFPIENFSIDSHIL